MIRSDRELDAGGVVVLSLKSSPYGLVTSHKIRGFTTSAPRHYPY